MSQRRTSFVAKSCRKILLDYLFFNFVVDKVDGKYALFMMGGGRKWGSQNGTENSQNGIENSQKRKSAKIKLKAKMIQLERSNCSMRPASSVAILVSELLDLVSPKDFGMT